MANLRKSRATILVLLAASLVLLVPATAAARVHVGIGFFGPVYPYGYWGPGWGPYGGGYPYGPYAYGGGYYGRPLGEVKIKSPEPDARIYINGSLAGRAHELKHFYLRPGSYNIEQRVGGEVQKQRVYVLADRTVKVEFGPSAEAPPRDHDHDRDRDRDRDHERDHDRDYK